jgi:hypothetical protein
MMIHAQAGRGYPRTYPVIVDWRCVTYRPSLKMLTHTTRTPAPVLDAARPLTAENSVHGQFDTPAFAIAVRALMQSQAEIRGGVGASPPRLQRTLL